MRAAVGELALPPSHVSHAEINRRRGHAAGDQRGTDLRANNGGPMGLDRRGWGRAVSAQVGERDS
jgi:hypothetical protein